MVCVQNSSHLHDNAWNPDINESYVNNKDFFFKKTSSAKENLRRIRPLIEPHCSFNLGQNCNQ